MKGFLFKNIAFLAVFSGFLMLSGCMVGPDYERPATAAEASAGYFRSGEHSRDANDLAAIDGWWQRFGDPVTADLVLQALENNYDLKAAAARVLQAEALFTETSGRKLPEVSYNLGRSRSKMSFNFGGSGRFSVLNTTYSQDISVSYILDLFGKLKRAERAAWEELLGTEASEQAIIHSLIANVIKARVEIATIQRGLAIARANTQSRQKTLEIVERRYKQGLVGPVDVRLARENLAAAKSVEPGLELLLIKAHHALDVLLGHKPGSSGYLPETLAELPDLETVPIGLPAALLDRRPDIMAAEFSLRAANEQIGVSVAQLYPDLTLTGSLGRSADRFGDLWIPETETYGLVLNLMQPIFNGGQLRAQVDRSKGRYSELAANYAGAVLTALREVEDVLASEEMLGVQFEYVEVRFREARAAENLSRQRYQRGVESILAVLESERRRRIAENELAILKGKIWTARVNLFLALGGDWTGQREVEG
jgi:multidrug efflux system outer membrane protein